MTFNHRHHCADWDFMLINPGDPEMRSCMCPAFPYGAKTTACLQIAGYEIGSLERTHAVKSYSKAYSEKAIWRKMEHLAKRGWVEYGTSVTGAWLTPEGETEYNRCFKKEQPHEV